MKRPPRPAPPPATAAPRGEAPVHLTVAAYPPVDQSVLRGLALFRVLHPEVVIRVAAREMHDHHRALAEVLANGVDVPDVVALEATYLSRFAALGGLAELSAPPFDGEALLPQVAPYAIPAARAPGGALVAIPADVGPAVSFYRKDLLEQAGVDPAELATWAGLLEAGRKVHRATKAALLGDLLWCAELVARSLIPPGEGLYFDAFGAPRLRSERFVVALEFAREARAANADARLEEGWSPRWIQHIQAGLIAVQPGGPWLTGVLESWLAPDSRGLWRTTDLPGGVHTAFGGTYYAITRRSPHAALAWEFVKLMCLDRRLQLGGFQHSSSFPASLAVLEDPFFDEPVPFLGGQRARQHWRAVSAAVPVLPAHPLESLAMAALRRAVRAVVDHGQDVALALAEAERRVWRLLREGS